MAPTGALGPVFHSYIRVINEISVAYAGLLMMIALTIMTMLLMMMMMRVGFQCQVESALNSQSNLG